jgi:hypothetical protein
MPIGAKMYEQSSSDDSEDSDEDKKSDKSKDEPVEGEVVDEDK